MIEALNFTAYWLLTMLSGLMVGSVLWNLTICAWAGFNNNFKPDAAKILSWSLYFLLMLAGAFLCVGIRGEIQ